MNRQSQHVSDTTGWVRFYRLAFAVLTLIAVAAQLQKSPNIINFFSFFTIQSNVIGALVLLVAAILVPKGTRNWALIRGAAVIFLVLTGVIYNTLLVDITAELQTTIPWVNNVLHIVMPIVMLVDLMIVPLSHRLQWREATIWAVYPLMYLVYSLVRGHFVDWYPYPFLDPGRDGGYASVLGFSVIVLVGFLAFTWFITEVNAWRMRQTDDWSPLPDTGDTQ